MPGLSNIKRVLLEKSETVNAIGVERMAYSGANKDILLYSPIVNVGWNDSFDCMDVKRVDTVSDIILGLSLTPMGYEDVRLIKYITNGLIVGIDTSDWALGDAIRSNENGILTNETSSLVYDINPQIIATVERIHTTLGEINVVLVSSAVDSGARRKKNVAVAGGADTAITFDRPMGAIPHIDVSVRDEAGVAIGADALNDSQTGCTVSVSSGGSGVHKMYYRAEVDA